MCGGTCGGPSTRRSLTRAARSAPSMWRTGSPLRVERRARRRRWRGRFPLVRGARRGASWRTTASTREQRSAAAHCGGPNPPGRSHAPCLALTATARGGSVGAWSASGKGSAGITGVGDPACRSMSTVGSRRSSQRGVHQLASPRSVMAAGTRTMRTIVASMKMAVARPRPEHLGRRVVTQDEAEEDRDHDQGGRCDHAGRAGDAVDDCCVVVAGTVVLLAHPESRNTS